MATLTVGSGSGFNFNTLSSAIAASQDGDVIQVQAGTYTNDFSTIATNITIEGVGGLVNLVATVPPPNLQGILTINANATLDNIAFSGAAIPDADGGNAAGIRYHSGNLVLDHCYFHDNQEGLLGGAAPNGTITISNSEFANNGNADPPASGIEHNLYVGAIQQLTITNSYFHGAIIGHEIKSRAANTVIVDSRIGNGPTGIGSYAIDLPNGGNALVENNVIEKGPNSANSTIISYGEEGGIYANSALTANGNTVLNDKGSPSVMFVSNLTGVSVSVTGNTFYGFAARQLVSGPADQTDSNTLLPLSGETTLDTSHAFLPVLPIEFACFASGTRILTDDGERPVETLRIGQTIVVVPIEGGPALPPEHDHRTALRRIRWIGHRSVDLRRHCKPRLAQPIRIRRAALADTVPQRDLLISPDHALLLNNLLIPARLLLNGATIVRDERSDTVQYFHIELDQHSIVLAESLATETYLDTGNRATFTNAGASLPLHPDVIGADAQARREALSCAPFAADPARVEPIWRRLAERAIQLGHRLPTIATTSDPALRVTVNGREILPAERAHRRYSFILPRSTCVVHLVSRATAPCDVTPWCEDRRRLGVAVGRIVVTGTAGPVVVPLDHPMLTNGWAAPERQGSTAWRWTLGSATLALPPHAAVLEIHLIMVSTYRLDTPPLGLSVAA